MACLCGCTRKLSKRQQRRHLQGKGTVAVLAARQHNDALNRVRGRIINRARHHVHPPTHYPRVDQDLVHEPNPGPSPSPTSPSQPVQTSTLSPEYLMDVDHNGSTLSSPTSVNSPSCRRHPAMVDEVFSSASDSESETDSEQYNVEDSDPERWTDGEFGAMAEELNDDEEAPWLKGLGPGQILDEEFEAEASSRDHVLSEDDVRSIRAHNVRVGLNLGARSYTMLQRGFPELSDLLSTQRLQTRIAFLSGIKPVKYSCCINCCCCFTGSYESLNACPYCDEPRYDKRRRPRKTFSYLPLIPRLVNMFQDKAIVEKMKYRSNYPHGQGPVEDIFDGSVYHHLLHTKVTVGGETLPHNFFSQPTDIAMGISTDGFCPFKRRKQTCWPIIGFNFNLPPEVRFQLNNVICFGVVPGPKQPKDMDSFYVPLVDEFVTLARGVPAFDSSLWRLFVLHVYLFLVFGDMPAIAKLMRMKGHNGLSPCRACRILGVRDRTNPQSTTYYTPLHRHEGASYDPLNLPRRTHDEFIRQATQVETAPTEGEADKRAKEFGIKGLPIIATLSSIIFPICFPHDFMHAVIENVLVALVSLWTGTYKGLDSGCEDYQISPSVWEAIGKACIESGYTIPAAFGCRVPNITNERHHFIAESWLLFATLLGPVLLHRRFSRPIYYQHFISLVKLINKCLQLSFSEADISEIEHGFASWVKEFERIYYQYDESRRCVCTLPVHSLLHIADDIRQMGPVWCYWAFVMERFCGSLLPAVKSKKAPYTSLANRVRDIAQLNQLKTLYHLHDMLNLSDRRAEELTGQHVDGYAGIALLTPHRRTTPELSLRKKIAAYLSTNYGVSQKHALEHLPQRVIQWGKLRFHEKKFTLRAKEMGETSAGASSRNATFMKYTSTVDRNRKYKNKPPKMEDRIFYGQLLSIFQVDIPIGFAAQPTPASDAASQPLILALIAPAKLDGKNKLGMPYFKQSGTPLVLDINCIEELVGRVPSSDPGGYWAFVQRTGAVALFDEFGDELADGSS